MMKWLQEEGCETWDEPGCSAGLHCRRLPHMSYVASPSQSHRWNCYRKKDMNLAAMLVCIVVVFLTCHMPRPLLSLIDETVTGRRIWTVRWTWLQCWSASSSSFSRTTCRVLCSISSMKLLQEEGYEPWDELGCSAGLHCRRLSHVPHAASYQWHYWRKKDMNCEMNLAAVLVCIVVIFLTCHMPCLLLNLINETVAGRRIWTVRWTWLPFWPVLSLSFSLATCYFFYSISSMNMKLLQEEGFESWDEPGCSAGLHCCHLSHVPHSTSPSQSHQWNCYRKKDLNREMNWLQCWSALLPSFSRATCHVSFSISSMELLQEEGHEPWDEPGCSAGLHCCRLSHVPHAASPSQSHRCSQHPSDHCVSENIKILPFYAENPLINELGR